MKLLTKTIESKIPALYSQEKVGDPIVRVKFFAPWSKWTWYVLEGAKDEGDFRFFGYVVGQDSELGYFSLNQLESVKGPMGLRIERDLHFQPTPLSEIKKKYES